MCSEEEACESCLQTCFKPWLYRLEPASSFLEITLSEPQARGSFTASLKVGQGQSPGSFYLYYELHKQACCQNIKFILLGLKWIRHFEEKSRFNEGKPIILTNAIRSQMIHEGHSSVSTASSNHWK